jgi:hypothetical protein
MTAYEILSGEKNVNAGSTQAPIHECIFYPGSMELVQARLPR